MMVKLIIFDFWGTLVANGIYSPVKQVKFILGIQEEFSDYIVKFEEAFMTKEFENLEEAFRAVVKAFDLPENQKQIDDLIGMWNKNTLLAKIFRETLGVLEDLKQDYKIALISNTDNFSVKQVVDKFDLSKYFDYMFFSCSEGRLKGNPESFEKILKETGVEKEEAVMVGDSIESDMKGAEKAGIRAILIDRRDRRDYEEKVIDLRELREIL